MPSLMCVYACRHVLLMLWEHKSGYTVTLWGLACLMGTKCKSPLCKSFIFRVKNWFKVRVKVRNVVIMVRELI